jgi:hypothetical protein
VTRRTLTTTFPPVTMTSPDGSTRTITLNQSSLGLGLGVIDVDKPGLYRFDDGTLHTVAAVGNPDPLEFSDNRRQAKAASPALWWPDMAGKLCRPRHPIGAAARPGRQCDHVLANASRATAGSQQGCQVDSGKVLRNPWVKAHADMKLGSPV